MAFKRKTGQVPMEWISAFRTKTANEGFTSETIDFDLDDDEVAEIKMVDFECELAIPAVVIDEASYAANQGLFTDPSFAAADPFGAVAYEDIEQLCNQHYRLVIDVNATAGLVNAIVTASNNKVMNFPEPGLLIANNLSWITGFDVVIGMDYGVRIYFKRRKAGSDELARTLLKRR